MIKIIYVEKNAEKYYYFDEQMIFFIIYYAKIKYVLEPIYLILKIFQKNIFLYYFQYLKKVLLMEVIQ